MSDGAEADGPERHGAGISQSGHDALKGDDTSSSTSSSGFDDAHWVKFVGSLPFSSTYPKFPTGDLVEKFTLSETPDFRKGRDWVWRSKSKTDMYIEGIGDGVQRDFVCAGVMECDKCGAARRAPADGNRRRLRKWSQSPCKACAAKHKNESRRRGSNTKPKVPGPGTSKSSLDESEDTGSKSDSSVGSSSAQKGPSWTHVKCKCRLILTSFEDANLGLFEHQNHHTHGEPDTRRPRPSEKEALKKVVLAHPGVKPKGLSMGLAKAGAGQMTKVPVARDLSTTFVNLSRLAYHRVNILNEGGIRPRDGHRDGPILEFVSMQGDGKSGTGVAVRVADFVKSQFKVIIQTDWQRDIFLDRNGDFGGGTGMGGGARAGVLTDVTFSVFKDFYLCGSAVFSPSLGRWVPVLWSIFQNQREVDFAAHFGYLWRIIDEAALSDDAAHELMSGVVDFSQAQLNGFKNAYRSWALKRKRLAELSDVALQAECTVLDEKAQKMLKGCGFHFMQSAERVKKNGSFVQTELRSRFAELLKSLRTVKDQAVFLHTMRSVEKEFPKCIEWLHWWIRCDIASLVFPAQRVMEQEAWDAMPTTTSALESLHALYYLSWERKMDLHSGADSLQRLAELMQAEYEAEADGIATRYGTSDHYDAYMTIFWAMSYICIMTI